ncbi:MAG: hypothetical protein LWX83_18210 [Anaerolineae bacterium]|nr:hypothetical protein [Anaerolineae bacterium]
MANLQEVINFEKKSTSDCYDAALAAFPKAGFSILKKREIAYYALAQITVNGNLIDGTIMVRPGGTPQMTISVGCNEMNEEELKPISEKLINAIKNSF